jgi:hypothetical protein
MSDWVKLSVLEARTQCCHACVSCVKIGSGRALLLLQARTKLYSRAYRETVCFDSKERPVKVCVRAALTVLLTVQLTKSLPQPSVHSHYVPPTSDSLLVSAVGPTSLTLRVHSEVNYQFASPSVPAAGPLIATPVLTPAGSTVSTTGRQW